MQKQDWMAIRSGGYAVPAGQSVVALTPDLLRLLGSTDPDLRDLCAYEILATWLSRGHYSVAERQAMARALTTNLAEESGADGVFLRAFSVLILGEIIHQDGKAPTLPQEDLQAILEAGLVYLNAERDLRGFVPAKGWAHACAHTADCLRSAAGHPALGAPDLERILEAVLTRLITPPPEPFIANEEDRLALAVSAALKRNLLSAEFVTAWLQRLVGHSPWLKEFVAGRSQAGYHFVHGFLKSLCLLLDGHSLQPAVRGALKAMASWWR